MARENVLPGNEPALIHVALGCLSPVGKIIFAVSVFICFHLMEGGLPPNSWAELKKEYEIKSNEKRNLYMQSLI